MGLSAVFVYDPDIFRLYIRSVMYDSEILPLVSVLTYGRVPASIRGNVRLQVETGKVDHVSDCREPVASAVTKESHPTGQVETSSVHCTGSMEVGFGKCLGHKGGVLINGIGTHKTDPTEFLSPFCHVMPQEVFLWFPTSPSSWMPEETLQKYEIKRGVSELCIIPPYWLPLTSGLREVHTSWFEVILILTPGLCPQCFCRGNIGCPSKGHLGKCRFLPCHLQSLRRTEGAIENSLPGFCQTLLLLDYDHLFCMLDTKTSPFGTSEASPLPFQLLSTYQ
ncbi:uncharacterized protein LOC122218539 [Panthera leo]|uniref:uncharacterized protein LOC122218539 n=1 Tax=Panthera leo TaxID=9689 RepID=UPI001C69B7CF|nr:uncharacterized protein LOC122218539 [Panthera leo]